MNLRKNIFLGVTVIITVLLITIGVSYAYFTANLTGGESATTITVTGGTMNIIYDGGATINISNIIPSDNPATTKTFTVTGNNTTDVEMIYMISFVIESNNFSEEALKYKLTSTNTGGNGTVLPSITTLTKIGTGSKTIFLGIGEFTSPTGGNKVHTYNLEIYFPNAPYNQNIDQEKTLNAYINIGNLKQGEQILQRAILAQNGGAIAIETKGTPDFSVINGTSGLYAAADEYGTSYYYRGLKSNLNNNLIFGGFQWKIIRINGDGSIRIIYNGTEAQFNSSSTMNTAGTNTQISGTHAWNTTYFNDAKYVGYMYGGANGVASTSRDGSVSTAATYNQTSSNAKTKIDAWYQTNISGKAFESKIIDNLFCNDRQIKSGLGYGSGESIYAAHLRLASTKAPTLKCGLKNDRFTKNDTVIGNGSLTYPVGLITIDEVAMAGMVYDKENLTNYLYTGQGYYTSTPMYKALPDKTYMWFVQSTGGILDGVVNTAAGLRAVLNLSSLTLVTGNGSATNPFRVINN